MCELKSLEKLKSIVAQMPDHNPGTKVGHTLELEVLDGLGISQGLYKDEKIAIAITSVSIGSIFEIHYHQETEYITVYEGELLLWVGCESMDDMYETNPIALGVGDMFVIKPNTPHIAKANSNTKLAVITIPASKYFPNA